MTLTLERLKILPGFRDHPDLVRPEIENDTSGFYIGEYELDKDHWPQGFATA